MKIFDRLLKPNVAKLEQQHNVAGLVEATQHPDPATRYASTCALLRLGETEALIQVGSPIVDLLTQALEDPDQAVRQSAAVALGRSGQADAVEPLIATLGSVDNAVQLAAIQALGQIGDGRAVEPLAALLKGEGEQMSRAATQALGQIGDSRAVEALIALLEEGNEEMHQVAVQALVQTSELAVEPLIALLKGEDEEARRAAIQTLAQIGKPAIGPLIAVLKDPKGHIRRNAAEALDALGWNPGQDSRGALYHIAKGDWERCVQIGAQAVEPLILALRGDARQAATRALGQLGDTRAVEPLVAALKDASGGTRRTAIEALGQIGDARAVEPLVAILRDTDSGVRQATVLSLEQVGDARAVGPLAAALQDTDSSVREAAARALGQLGDARAVESLLAALKDPNGWVRRNAAEALDTLNWQAGSDSTSALYYIARGEWTPCIEIGAEAVEPLVATLRDDDPTVAQAAAKTLGQIGDARAIKSLIEAFKRREVAQAAGQALASLGEPAIKLLVSALQDKSIQAHATQALVQIGQPAVVELITALKTPQPTARQAAAKALGYIQATHATDPLCAALQDDNANVRGAAAEALGYIRDSSAVEPLVAKLRDDNACVRESATLSLSALADERAVGPLLLALKDAESNVRQAAAMALGQTGDSRAIEPLEAFRSAAPSEAERRAAGRALDLLGPRTAFRVGDMGRMLVVEDDLNQADVLKAYFGQGYQVTVVKYGQEAISWCRQYWPDAVLLDIGLPDIDGYEVCSQLRASSRTNHLIIFFLTQRSDRASRLAGLEQEADDYVTKPYDIEELRLRVGGAIRRAHEVGTVNPTTGLPSGQLVERQIRELTRKYGWGLLHINIDHLAPFKAKYGQTASDEVLRATALLIGEVIDQFSVPDDFAGHIGDHKFIVITSTEKAQAIKEAMLKRFNAEIGVHYDAEDRKAGRMRFEGQQLPFVILRVDVVDSGEDTFAATREINRVIAELRRL